MGTIPQNFRSTRPRLQYEMYWITCWFLVFAVAVAEEFALHEIFSDARTDFFRHEIEDFPSKCPRSVRLLEVHMVGVSRHVSVLPLRL